MRRRVGLTLAGIFLASLLLMPSPAFAWCWGDTECAAGDTCQWTWRFIAPWRDCHFTLCNTDSDCRGGTLCTLGTCQGECRTNADCASNRCENSRCAAPTSSGGSGSGKPVPGEGRKCMPPDGSKPAGWATDHNGKPLGPCPRGTYCANTGFCRRFEQ